MEDNAEKYADILHLPHPVSKTRVQMSMMDRAAQFSPFAALSGYEAAVRETVRATVAKVESSEEELTLLDRKFHLIKESLPDPPLVTFLYFEPDPYKAGGAYVSITGKVKKVDDFSRLIVLTDGSQLLMDDILSVEGSIFSPD